ncbi:MAG: hypothetical protein WAW17_04815 [Rhodococcus sp. (in: high G+C Gram-positive bacteria)]|uniref:hypothetical protein n=1 Tax=Rhodococcus sp. TaxID=1831 RepID=UPI003BB03216
MTEPPLDRLAQWYPPFESAPAPQPVATPQPAVAPEPEPREPPPPPPPTWLTGADETDPPLPVPDGREGRKLAVAGAAAAVLAVLIGVVAVATSISQDRTGRPVATAESSAWCALSESGSTVTGNGPGGTSDGAQAILSFDYAYYALRSGTKAREVVTSDATVNTAEAIQAGIDSTPEGTEHCLAITRIEAGRYAVTLSERRPDGSEQKYEQVVTTTDRGGRTLITSIGVAN